MTKAVQINIACSMISRVNQRNQCLTVNSLLPGPTATEGLGDYIDGLAKDSKSTREEAIANYFKTREPTHLLQRFLTLEEVSNVALSLASEISWGINGAEQKVEGLFITT